jgi:rSAM/selenodomain-associated transferase 2
MRLSIIVPVLNEAETIVTCLSALQALRERGHEVIVADGGSADATADLARPLADRLVASERGRSKQMNAGAAQARGSVLLFLHADVRLPAAADNLVHEGCTHQHKRWGRFDLRLSGDRGVLRCVETLMNWRSRWTGIATGDQAIFVERKLFDEAGGFPAIALMEDIALSRTLKRLAGWPLCLEQPVFASSRRWERNGIVRTILLMWRLRLAYWMGMDPARLARVYYPPAKT